MKHTAIPSSLLLKASALIAMAAMATSCTTTYDACGRPVYSVDPALAVAGVAAAGVIGYAIADNNRGGDCHGGRYYSNHGRGHYGGHGRDCRY